MCKNTRTKQALSQPLMDPLDRMDEIGYCWQALGDLMNPDCDFQAEQRDNLAILIDFLAREYEQARRAFHESLHSPAPAPEKDPNAFVTVPELGGISAKRRT